jgi:two-component system, chemotaxis family, protein-glutamate methylesterase/glutaminase
MTQRVVVMGGSWGGLTAMRKVLIGLPSDFPDPVVVAQHQSPDGLDGALVDTLGRDSRLPVRWVDDKDPITSGSVYVAPPDYHLLIDDGHFALSIDERVHFSRPSIDVLFESAAHVYSERTVGVILTGANEDGAGGCLRIRRAGGVTVAQDPDSAERKTMPEAAIAAGGVTHILPLDSIASFLVHVCTPTSETQR